MTSATDVLEAVARGICRENLLAPHHYWGTRTVPTGEHLEACVDANWRQYVPEARAAISALAANVSPEMVEAARIALIPALDECHMDDWPEDTKREIHAALAAAIRAGGEP